MYLFFFSNKPQRNQDTKYIYCLYREITNRYQQLYIVIRQSLLASEHGLARPGMRHNSGALSHVTRGGVTHYGGAVRCVLIDSNDGSGTNTGIVTWNTMHVS